MYPAVLFAVRFIPAGAGNTITNGEHSTPGTLHPRWRGEHVQHGMRVGVQRASSPLARGTLLKQLGSQRHVRFIPAGAGNTTLDPLHPMLAALHPRWRGEHIRQILSLNQADASSPLARGTPFTQAMPGTA